MVYEFAGTLAAGAIVGWLVDRWLASPPWAVVVCTLAAVVGGFVRLITALRRFDQSDREAEP
jgi:F0F1-type ATP synthase assembly protein I